MFSFDQQTEYAFDPDVMKVFIAAIINSFRVRVNDVSNDYVNQSINQLSFSVDFPFTVDTLFHESTCQ